MPHETNSVEGASRDDDNKGSFWVRFRDHFHMRPPDDDEDQDWWAASTAIPLVAATTGPLANLMSIVALVSPWRSNIHWSEQDVDGGAVQVGFRDPTWCIALNATSLACGVTGNIFLLCNFTRTVRYIVALPVSIFLWFAATVILIGITVAMHVYDSPIPPNQTFSQAYWSAVISAVLYFMLCVILMINMLGYFLGHYPQNFALTDDQRTLILQTIAFVAWLAIGGVIFSQAIGISYPDALYFSDITILTLGFGDITPTDSVGRGLILPYAVIGMIMLGLVVSSVHRFAREIQHDNIVMKHIDRKRMAAVERSESAAVEYHPQRTRAQPVVSSLNGAFSRVTGNRSRLMVMREEKDRFDTMRAIQHETSRYRRWSNLTLSIAVFGIVWTIGSLVFWLLEDGISYFQALYFGFCSLLTIGYGDITPTSNAGRPFFIVWSLIAVPTMTTLISKMSDTVVHGYKYATSAIATWTFLPESGQYSAFFSRHPHIPAFFKRYWKRRQKAPEDQTHKKQDAIADMERGRELRSVPAQQRGPSLEELSSRRTATDLELAQELAFAIQRTVKDAIGGGPKKYSYEEWVEFVRLIRFTDPKRVRGFRFVLDEDEYGILNWDWIGESSPMMTTQTEPEWVLNRLCESLVRAVAMLGQNNGMVLRRDSVMMSEDASSAGPDFDKED